MTPPEAVEMLVRFGAVPVLAHPAYLVDMEQGMDAALPAEHWWRERERNWKNVKPEQAPLWDVAFTYDKGSEWGAAPPVPRGMVKQVFFYGEQADGPTGMFFTDFKKEPADGDWISKVALAMASLTGKEPKKTTSPLATTPAASIAGCEGGAMKVLQGGGTMVIRRPAKAPEDNYPDTIAGLMARSFIEAFNSGDPQKVQEAAEAYRSKSALESSSMDERLEQYEQLYKDWGRLVVQAFEEHDDGSLTLTTKPDRGYAGLSLTFSFEKDGGKIDEIRITPTMNLDEDSDDASKGIMGEVTVLSGSIEPLRDHFNSHKDKHRFIAILSPT